VNSYTNYVLEDTGARIEYKAVGVYALKLKCRVLIA
jgi:hypothetical protein